MPSIFTRIINGEIPCYKIAEDDSHFAFLDIRPLQKGHTLVIPKKEVDYIYDLPANELSALHIFAQNIAHAQQKAIACNRVCSLVIGFEVPHAHIHLIPANEMSDVNFKKKPLALTKEEMQEIAESIKRFL